MDIRQLNYFIQVADCGSYSKASQKLFISQPALSKTIKNMESEMGFTFFYTHHRKQLLTEAGQAFYDKAVHFLKEYNSLMNTEYKDSGIISGHLSIGFSTVGEPALLAHLSPLFHTAYPMIDISLIERDSRVIVEDVIKGNVDAAFVDLYYLNSEEFSLFDIYDLIESEFVAVVHESDPLSKKSQLSYDDLDGKGIMFFQTTGSPFGLSPIDLSTSKARPKIILTSTQWHMIFALAEVGYGITIAPYYIFSKLGTPGLKAIPFDDPSSRHAIALITKKSSNRSKALNAFIDFCSDKSLYADLAREFLP